MHAPSGSLGATLVLAIYFLIRAYDGHAEPLVAPCVAPAGFHVASNDSLAFEAFRVTCQNATGVLARICGAPGTTFDPC
jgi:hypothetical protein